MNKLINLQWKNSLKVGSPVMIWGSFKYRRLSHIIRETSSQWCIEDGRKFRKEDLFSEDRKGFGNKILVQPTKARIRKMERNNSGKIN